MRIAYLPEIVVVVLFLACLAFGQDGSDMRYLKPEVLTAKDVGKWVHLDFGNNSFLSAFAAKRHGKRRGDSVKLVINGKQTEFVEFRSDDGFNSWFADQYLETVDLFNGLKIRWIKNKLLSIDGKTIKVEAYFHYYTPTGNAYRDKAFTKELSFDKAKIAMVLVKVD